MNKKNNHDQGAPSPHAKALSILHAKLAAAELSESDLLNWLKERQAVPEGIFALRSIPTRRLEIILENWEEVADQLQH